MTIQVTGKQLVTLPFTSIIGVTGKPPIYILPLTSMVTGGSSGNAQKVRALHTKAIYASFYPNIKQLKHYYRKPGNMKQPDPELKELMSSKIIEAIMRLYWDNNYPIGSDFMYIRNQNNGDVFTYNSTMGGSARNNENILQYWRHWQETKLI